MEEAIVDVALDLNLFSSEQAPHKGAQQDTRTDHGDQAQLLATVQQTEQGSSPLWHAEQSCNCSPERPEELSSSWLQNRAARVEALHQRVANGTYQIDSAELASRLLQNSTRLMETC